MVKVEETPDLVTTNQNDQMKTTEIPAINPKKYSPLSISKNPINFSIFIYEKNISKPYLTVLLSPEKQQKIIILKEKQFAYTLIL